MRLMMQVGGAVFSIGTSYSGIPGAGAVSFRANDTCVNDNSGIFEVTLSTTVDPCPDVAPQSVSEPVPVTGGPGTELKTLLKYIGIVATPNCSCNARAAEMDRREAETPGWCAENMETILDWLKEQADNRGLPFVRMGAKVLVRRAISNARKKQPQKDSNQ